MSVWVALAIAMVMAGLIAKAPGVLLIAVLTATYGSLTAVWTRYGAQRLDYTRQLATERAVAGDSVQLDITIWNRKRLPLPWVTAEDRVAAGLTVRERPELDRAAPADTTPPFRNDWALTWYERVVRHFHLDDLRRGSYRFGPVHLFVHDILGRPAADAELELTDTLLVAPRTAAVHHPEHDVAPLGERRARSSLTTDPALYAGVRPFQPGDSVRQIHWRATARVGSPVSRRLEPARGRDVVLVVDVQTVDGPYWLTWDEDAFEALCVVAASLARQLLAGGASVGMAAASFGGSSQKIAWLPPRASLAQLPRAGELLARIRPVPSGPLSELLSWLNRHVPPGTSIVLITARDPGRQLAALRRMKRLGYGVELVMIGPDAADHARAVRLAGLRAVSGRVEPSWENPDAVTLAG